VTGSLRASRTEIAREWTRIGCVGFGGPPAHMALLRELCVEKRGWMEPVEFEDAVAACNLLPGPASTQMAIFCAWRQRGWTGALIGGAGFILPGLLVILALCRLFLPDAPGAAVAAVALKVGLDLYRPGMKLPYLLAGALAAALVGPYVVLVLLACGAIETGRRVFAFLTPIGGGGLAWVAFKVGALSYGGGFVIIPLMQSDAVDRYHWLTEQQFLSAVALGQVTPGPVTHTVAAVGYAAAGNSGALFAAAIAFAPSFLFILGGAARFDRLRANPTVRAFLDGAAPAAIGAIMGSVIPLALALSDGWQYAVLGVAAVALLFLRAGIVVTLVAGGLIGAVIGS
jgi:chromate transporter